MPPPRGVRGRLAWMAGLFRARVAALLLPLLLLLLLLRIQHNNATCQPTHPPTHLPTPNRWTGSPRSPGSARCSTPASPNAPSTTPTSARGGGYGGLFSVSLASGLSPTAFYDALDVYKGPSLGTNYTLACPYTLLVRACVCAGGRPTTMIMVAMVVDRHLSASHAREPPTAHQNHLRASTTNHQPSTYK